eukprot:2734565-Rhodomonas_salina.2
MQPPPPFTFSTESREREERMRARVPRCSAEGERQKQERCPLLAFIARMSHQGGNLKGRRALSLVHMSAETASSV